MPNIFIRECLTCLTSFDVDRHKNARKIFCSVKCRPQNMRKRPILYRKCLICGIIFKWKFRAERKGEYCGFMCSQKGIAINSIGKRSEKMRKRTSGKCYIKFGSRHEHRVIVEKSLGRKLSFNEVVHHLNHNRKDNRLENLQVMLRSEHTRLHTIEMHKKRMELQNVS